MKRKILIFVVTYKASFRILRLINKIPFSKLKKINYKILISDDNSEDEDTIKYINLAKNRFKSKVTLNFNKENLGYGFGVNTLTPSQKNILIFSALALGFLFFLSLYGLR